METLILEENAIDQVAGVILSKRKYSGIILLKGDLGAGKTTLARQLIRQCGVDATITSPTFNLISEYKTPSGETIYHFDLYRLRDMDELYGIGFEEIIDSGYTCIIEWPEIAMPLLDMERIEVNIVHADGKRIYTISEL